MVKMLKVIRSNAVLAVICTLLAGPLVGGVSGCNRGDKGPVPSDSGKGTADQKPSDAKKDEERLQGTWLVVSGEHAGKPVPAEMVQGLRQTMKGNRLTVQSGTKTLGEGTFTLDPMKKPPAIDVELIEKDGKTKRGLGIYELDGDTLKLCMDPKERPTDFKTKAGSEAKLTIYKREKPEVPVVGSGKGQGP
jgi:uncharacterized protein (TIGR03067 family)